MSDFSVQQFRLMTKKERKRQVKKWGDQHHDEVEWFGIFAEEVGEVAKAVNQWKFGESSAKPIITEMVQCAALLEAWVNDSEWLIEDFINTEDFNE